MILMSLIFVVIYCSSEVEVYWSKSSNRVEVRGLLVNIFVALGCFPVTRSSHVRTRT